MYVCLYLSDLSLLMIRQDTRRFISLYFPTSTIESHLLFTWAPFGLSVKTNLSKPAASTKDAMRLMEYTSDLAHSPTLERAGIKTLRLGRQSRPHCTGSSAGRHTGANADSETGRQLAAKDEHSESNYDSIIFYRTSMLDEPAAGFDIRFVPIVPGFQDQSGGGLLAIIGSAVWEGDAKIGPTYACKLHWSSLASSGLHTELNSGTPGNITAFRLPSVSDSYRHLTLGV